MFEKANTSETDVASPAKKDLGIAANIMMWLQLFMIILFARCTKFAAVTNPPATGTVTQGYFYFGGIEIMMFIGFGYLMTFMKTYGLGAVGFTMLVTAIGLQWYIFAEGFFHQIFDYNSETEWKYIEIDIYTMMNCLFGISAVLISFGAVIGKIKPSQLIVMTIIELLFHAFNYECILIGGIKVADVGGTYADHMFGAYFGLAVSFMLTGSPKQQQHNVNPLLGYTADLFSFIGTLFLWIYWPSFVGGGLPADTAGQQSAIINTILALSASTMVTFYVSYNLHGYLHKKDGKPHRIFRPVDIQNATLAGGVAIGCAANFHMNPVNAIFIGFTAGLVSTLGYFFIQPFLFEKLGLHDTCGVHNLHGMPSIIGAVSTIVLAAYKQAEGRAHDTDIFYGHEHGQWYRQLTGMIATIVCAIVGGVFTGWVIRNINPLSKEDNPFDDSTYWETAEDFVQPGSDAASEVDVAVKPSTSTTATPRKDIEEGKDREIELLQDRSETPRSVDREASRRIADISDVMVAENNSLYMSN